jgi:hypothetical protein
MPAILQTAVSSVKVCLAVRLTAVMLYGMTFVQSLHILVFVLVNSGCILLQVDFHGFYGF